MMCICIRDPGFSLGSEPQESLTLGHKCSRVKMKIMSQRALIKGQKYFIIMER